MTSRDFCYWLQGYFEINQTNNLTNFQVGIIRRHLDMVFYHEIDPSFGEDKEQLQIIHDQKENDLNDLKKVLKNNPDLQKVIQEIQDEVEKLRKKKLEEPTAMREASWTGTPNGNKVYTC